MLKDADLRLPEMPRIWMLFLYSLIVIAYSFDTAFAVNDLTI